MLKRQARPRHAATPRRFPKLAVFAGRFVFAHEKIACGIHIEQPAPGQIGLQGQDLIANGLHIGALQVFFKPLRALC